MCKTTEDKAVPTTYEIERKFLIKMPDEKLLRAQEGCEVWDIFQSYITLDDGSHLRLRKVVCDGKTSYIMTVKEKINDLKRIEIENEISKEEYDAFFDTNHYQFKINNLSKTRYRIPYDGHIVEVDIYPFWDDCATAEIELSDENEACKLPDYLDLIHEVTGKEEYNNSVLAAKYK